MSLANADTFPCFPIQVPFISFSYLIALARTSSIMLNKSDSGYSYIVYDFICKNFNDSPLYMGLSCVAMSLSYVVFIMVRYIPYILSLLRDFKECLFFFFLLLNLSFVYSFFSFFVFGKDAWYDFNFLKFIKTSFMVLPMLYPGGCSMCAWKNMCSAASIWKALYMSLRFIYYNM